MRVKFFGYTLNINIAFERDPRRTDESKWSSLTPRAFVEGEPWYLFSELFPEEAGKFLLNLKRARERNRLLRV
jgi:hypothetical protein